jgi:hypothetical protein
VSEQETAKVSTFYDDEGSCEMELLSVSASGLCKVRFKDGEMDVTVARHKARVRPLNDAAREMLK